jgi:CheY-like chemotaxis protein
LKESLLKNPFFHVHNGQELLDFLNNRAPYEDKAVYKRPGLIFLDLNMPVKDGRTALREIKSDPDLKHIPIVIMTTSRDEIDVFKSYDLGANSYVVKPVTFGKMAELIAAIGNYWFKIVRIPQE